MAEAAVSIAITNLWDDGQRIHAMGTISVGASPGTYTTNGIAMDMATLPTEAIGLGVPLPGITAQPIWMSIESNAGYRYKFDRTNKKLIIRAGIADHTHDMLYIGGITATEAVAIQGGDTLGKNAATNRTIAGATSATKGGVVTSGLLASSELTGSAAIPAGVSGDTPVFYAIYMKMQ